jgi:S-layer homology domain
VIVTAVDDALIEATPDVADVSHSASSGDSDYDIVNAGTFTVTVIDDDSANVSVSPTVVAVTEGGIATTYALVLTAEPTADVQISIVSDDQTQGTAAVTSVTFTPINWNVIQNVSVSAPDDAVAEGDHSVQISHTAISADPDYNGIVVQSVTVNITDDDVLSVTAMGDAVGGVGVLSTFTATLNGPIDAPSYAWTALSPSGFPVATGTDPTFSFTPTSGGNYFVSVVVTDAGETSPVTGVVFRVLGDVGGSIFKNDIVWLANRGITQGCNPPDNDEFCPSDKVTRGQMAAFLSRALSLPSGGPNTFTDDDGSIFEVDIAKLAAAGITLGCNPPTNDQFCPNDFVTRGQMAAFLSRALDLPSGGPNTFIDDDGSVFEADIAKLAAAGITQGCNPPTNDQFCPNADVTREQMAAFLRRALDI